MDIEEIIIDGIVEDIVYSNPENGYSVIDINHNNQLVTAVGIMPSCCPGEKIKIKCEYKGRARKDNGFLEGTYFFGRFYEKNGVTFMKGIILTAPIYHTVLLLLFAFFIYRCIALRGFSIIPISLVLFSVFMFFEEFKKQGIIKKYIFRAFKNTFLRLNKKKEH